MEGSVPAITKKHNIVSKIAPEAKDGSGRAKNRTREKLKCKTVDVTKDFQQMRIALGTQKKNLLLFHFA